MIDKILDLSEYRGRFRKWLLDELIIRYPRRLNSLRFRDTIYLKGKGLRNSALDVLSRESVTNITSNILLARFYHQRRITVTLIEISVILVPIY